MLHTNTAFYKQTYQEHCSELGALLLSLESYFCDASLSWLAANDQIVRLEAHLDGLILGGDLAHTVCLENLESSDDDLVGAIFYIASRNLEKQGADADLAVLIEKMDEEMSVFFIVGEKYALSTGRSHNLVSYLSHKESYVRGAIVEVLGYRGDADPHRIWPLFHDEDESVKVAAMVAVMRLGFKKAVPAMEQAVLENKTMFNEHCVFPLLMLGSQKALQFSRLACQSKKYIKPQYPIYLALGGNEDDIGNIIKAMEFDDMNLAVLEALGIFGSLKGVKTLMQFLSSEDDEEKLAAAKSLNQISGAQLYETVTIIEKDDDDIDAQSITGKPAASGEAAQPGDERSVEVKQDCTDKSRWTLWWQENKNRFDPSVRYRKGKPYSFFLCLEEIAHPESNYEDRQRAYNELVMRSGHHIPFEPDWFVEKQINALHEWQDWWKQNKHTFTNPWSFDGA